jgi:acetyl-CoA carboxylase beta subunit
LIDHGMLDLVVDRRELKATITRALAFMGAQPAAAATSSAAASAAERPGDA